MREFIEARDRLLGIAYGITGDLGAAEDVVQDAWLRLARTKDNTGIEDVTGWLVVTTARLALDYVRSARHRREHYVGPWLPEPVVEGPEDRVTMAELVNLAMLVVLETLSPAERTVFVLHEVFGMPFGEVAEAVGRTPAAVRQLAVRARKHVQARTPRFDLDHSQQRQVVGAFAKACEGKNIEALLRVLDPDIVVSSDGGGVVRAARRPVSGAGKVARFLIGISRKATVELRPVQVNGWAGLLRFVDGQLWGVMALTVADGRVTAVDMVANLQKLTRVRALINGKDSQVEPRMKLSAEAYKHVFALEQWVQASSLSPTIRELVKLRVSQLNGCAFCIDMHSHDLKEMGETDERIYGVLAWDETPFFTDQERAALRLAEEGTKLTTGRVSDEAWAEAKAHFDDKTLEALVVAIATINTWNRFGTILQSVPGSLRKAAVSA